MKINLSATELQIIIIALETDIISDEVIQVFSQEKKDLLKKLKEHNNQLN